MHYTRIYGAFTLRKVDGCFKQSSGVCIEAASSRSAQHQGESGHHDRDEKGGDNGGVSGDDTVKHDKVVTFCDHNSI
jgi:hypothetical protein